MKLNYKEQGLDVLVGQLAPLEIILLLQLHKHAQQISLLRRRRVLRDQPIVEPVEPLVQLLHPPHRPVKIEPPQRGDIVTQVELSSKLEQVHHHLLELRCVAALLLGHENPPAEHGHGQGVSRAHVQRLTEVHGAAALGTGGESAGEEDDLGLADGSEVVDGLLGEQVGGAEPSVHPPSWAVVGED